jgi:small subunit ribosomal protein S10
MIKIRVKSLNKESINMYKNFVSKTFLKLTLSSSITSFPNKIKRITLLKSPHVNKTAREQFQIKSYKLLITLKSQISINELKFIIQNKPKTVKISISQN